MRFKEISEAVTLAVEPIVKVVAEDVRQLKAKCLTTQRKRTRICVHRSADDKVQEMIIALDRETYIRPHEHVGKSESFHVIEGTADIFVFDDDGNVTEVVPLGDYASGRVFYYRIADPFYHTYTIESKLLVIHETTSGPFTKEDAIFAPWAPPESDYEAAKAFMVKLAGSRGPFSERKAEK